MAQNQTKKKNPKKPKNLISHSFNQGNAFMAIEHD